ncbi:MAG: pyridoxamine 5'-phosphate oxidase [Flavobacteriales bacterium AspAUS03]
MDRDLSAYRKVYAKDRLLESDVPLDPLELFHRWFQEAERVGGLPEANAMSLSTIGQDGAPETRVVLLKGYSVEGFVFYTHHRSRKGQAMARDARVCLSFFWPDVQQQVIVKGRASKLSEKHSNEYFVQRPRNSQIGAWSSEQSQVIPSRAYLEEKFEIWKIYFETHPLECPTFWGGYLVQPYEIEFWQGRPDRLHDRLCYILEGKEWQLKRYSP